MSSYSYTIPSSLAEINDTQRETQSQVTKIENRGNCPVQVITNPSRLHSRMHLEAITTEPHLFERVLLEVPTTISYPTNKIIER